MYKADKSPSLCSEGQLIGLMGIVSDNHVESRETGRGILEAHGPLCCYQAGAPPFKIQPFMYYLH